MSRVLYTGNRNASSWALRAWLALKEQGIEFDEVVVDIRRPQRWENLKRIGEFSPPAAVPVLDDDGFIIFDSMAIMEYANEIGSGSLLPSDAKQRAKARSFAAWQHSTFGRVCSCLFFESAFYPDKRALSQDEVTVLNKVYDIWQHTIASFSGAYLVGDFSLADIMLLPSVIRFNAHYPPDERWPLVQRWFEQLQSRPFVVEWMQQAYELEPIYLPGYHNDP